jgi:hypothetical protein
MATKKNPAAVALGKLGGKKGGQARMRTMSAEDRQAFGRAGGLASAKTRAKVLTPAQRKAIAKKAAEARWGKGEKK